MTEDVDCNISYQGIICKGIFCFHFRWIGIDQSVQAIKVSEMRLQKQKIDFFVFPL
jgi:hypothetical protein